MIDEVKTTKQKMKILKENGISAKEAEVGAAWVFNTLSDWALIQLKETQMGVPLVGPRKQMAV